MKLLLFICWSLMASDHYDGNTFYNYKPGDGTKELSKVFKWYFRTKRAPWPKKEIPIDQTKPKPLKDEPYRITFINHATMLIQLPEATILTDPIYGKRASPVSWLGPKRVKRPGVAFEDLPKIDVVIISHNHYDHMHLPTLKKLAHKFSPVFLVGVGNATTLEKANIVGIKEMDWGDEIVHKKVKITFLRAQHWSRRGLFDTNKTLWGSFAIKSKSAHIYFAGDTGHGPHFEAIGKNYGPFDLALLPIGAYAPRWFMKFQHMNPYEAVLAHIELKAKVSIPMHYGLFQLSNEDYYEPLTLLQQTLIERKMTDQFKILMEGESYAPEKSDKEVTLRRSN